MPRAPHAALRGVDRDEAEGVISWAGDVSLAVVTKDELVIRPGDVAVDASGGFLIGQLAINIIKYKMVCQV